MSVYYSERYNFIFSVIYFVGLELTRTLCCDRGQTAGTVLQMLSFHCEIK